MELGANIGLSNGAFYACRNLKSITIPENIGNVEADTFKNCDGLKSITIPPSVKSMGNYVFEYCYHLKSVSLSPELTSIGEYCFESCFDLNRLTIPESVTRLNRMVFIRNYSLADVIIPDSVLRLENYVFSYCLSMICFDFSRHKSVPTLGSEPFPTSEVNYKIVVPDDLYEEWTSVEYWNAYIDYIVKASEYEQ